jgi:signal transduction histidine kinase
MGSAMDWQISPIDSATLNKKRTVLLLRTVVVISTGYLILFGPQAANPWALAYIATLLASNVALSLTPDAWFHGPRFSVALLLGDTAAVLVGLYLTVGCFSQDFLIIYFFTIFLTTATQSITQIAVGAAMISGLYGYWLWLSAGSALTSGEWLRLPFFFIVAVFYAYMTEETKLERWRREQAERERERLRFLLNLAEPMASTVMGSEWIIQVCGAIEAACPRLLCQIAGAPPSTATTEFEWFPIRGREETFGGLVVTAKDGHALAPAEEQFCRVVALMAGHVLGEAKMAHADANARLRQEFFGMLSHELRTPLHAILGYSEMLLAFFHTHPDAKARDVLDRLRINAKRLQDLLGELLWLAELRAGERQVEPEAIDLAETLENERLAFHDQLSGRPIEFDIDVASDVPAVFTDRRKLEQVLRSLISNALKFTDRGTVRASVRQLSVGEVEIAVSDTGVGIAPQHLESIFEDFQRLENGRSLHASGLGLGLALARELLTLLGGRISVESSPGAGTTFRLCVPVMHGHGAAEPAPEPVASPTWQPYPSRA